MDNITEHKFNSDIEKIAEAIQNFLNTNDTLTKDDLMMMFSMIDNPKYFSNKEYDIVFPLLGILMEKMDAMKKDKNIKKRKNNSINNSHTKH
jgi:hypothetical protein